MKRVVAALAASLSVLAGGLVVAAPAQAEECVRAAIDARYQQLGGMASAIGLPTSCNTPTRTGGEFVTFERGAIYWSPASGAWDVSGSFRRLWASTGWENGYLRYPTSGETAIRAGGVYQNYQGGVLYWTGPTGAHSVSGAFRALFAGTGWENGFLGYPTSQEVPVRGGVYQSFQGGVAYWSPGSGAHTVSGSFRGLFAAAGFENGYLGYPTSQETAIRDGGVYQTYQGGTMYWTQSAGAHVLRGAILGRYAQSGYENGALGYPTSSEFDIPGGKRTNFEGGYIEWSPSRGALVNEPVVAPGPVIPGTIAIPGSANLGGLVLSVDQVRRAAPPADTAAGYTAGDVPLAVTMTVRNTTAGFWDPFDILRASSNGTEVDQVFSSADGYGTGFDGPGLAPGQSRAVTVLFSVPPAVVGDFLLEATIYDAEFEDHLARFSTRL